MGRLKALELLEDPKYRSGLDMQGLERLLIQAGCDRNEAHKAAMDHGFNRITAGMTA